MPTTRHNEIDCFHKKRMLLYLKGTVTFSMRKRQEFNFCSSSLYIPEEYTSPSYWWWWFNTWNFSKRVFYKLFYYFIDMKIDNSSYYPIFLLVVVSLLVHLLKSINHGVFHIHINRIPVFIIFVELTNHTSF